MANNHDRAQVGLELIKEAILSELKAHPNGMTNAEIVRKLQLESDFEGAESELPFLVDSGNSDWRGKVRHTGERQSKTYQIVSERNALAGSK